MRLNSRLATGLGLSSSNIQTVFDIGESPHGRLRVAKLLYELDAPESVRPGSVLTKDPGPQEKLVSLIQGMHNDIISAVKEGMLADGLPGPIFYDGEAETRIEHGDPLVLTMGRGSTGFGSI